jgi:hypothetical protein
LIAAIVRNTPQAASKALAAETRDRRHYGHAARFFVMPAVFARVCDMKVGTGRLALYQGTASAGFSQASAVPQHTSSQRLKPCQGRIHPAN